MALHQQLRKRKYLEELSHYSIDLSEGMWTELTHKTTMEGQNLNPEVIGFLLGRARGVWKAVKCPQCNQLVKGKQSLSDNQEYKAQESTRYHLLRKMHNSCFESCLKELEK